MTKPRPGMARAICLPDAGEMSSARNLRVTLVSTEEALLDIPLLLLLPQMEDKMLVILDEVPVAVVDV